MAKKYTLRVVEGHPSKVARSFGESAVHFINTATNDEHLRFTLSDTWGMALDRDDPLCWETMDDKTMVALELDEENSSVNLYA